MSKDIGSEQYEKTFEYSLAASLEGSTGLAVFAVVKVRLQRVVHPEQVLFVRKCMFA